MKKEEMKSEIKKNPSESQQQPPPEKKTQILEKKAKMLHQINRMLCDIFSLKQAYP